MILVKRINEKDLTICYKPSLVIDKTDWFEFEELPPKDNISGKYGVIRLTPDNSTLYWEYKNITPTTEDKIDLFKEEFYNIQVGNEHTISAVRSSTQKVVDTLSSASVMKDFSDIKLAYDKGMIDEEIVLHKVKTACLDLADYNTITSLNILDTDITLEEVKLSKIASCKRYYNKLIEQGIQSNISGQMLIYEYDERDQQNFADKMNFFASKEITDKGVITQASEFPERNNVNVGDKYIINGIGIVDNDESKTNTGMTFTDGQEIYWNSTTWVDETYFNSTSWIGVGLSDENLKVPVVLTENQFKNLYAQIGINKETYIGLCGVKINEINNSTSIQDVYDITF